MEVDKYANKTKAMIYIVLILAFLLICIYGWCFRNREKPIAMNPTLAFTDPPPKPKPDKKLPPLYVFWPPDMVPHPEPIDPPKTPEPPPMV